MTAFKEYDSFDGLGLAKLAQQGSISLVEILEAAIEKIELLNPHINAVIHKLYDQAYASINKLNPQGPFYGVPFLLKDLLADYQDTPLTMGSRFAREWISSSDSEIVKRFKQSGVVIIGKSNVPEFGLNAVTEPEFFGPTRNPWNLQLTSGGSSGGSAAAVAAGMVPIAHGGDGAGSIRIPAAYCGVFGFKPTRGRTPLGPRFTRLWMGLIVQHVLTRSVRDSAAMLDVIAGEELGSPISLPKPTFSFLEKLEENPGKLRIAIADHPFFPAQISNEYLQALKKAGELCENLGHRVEYASPKVNHEETMRALLIMMMAEITMEINSVARRLNKKVNLRELEKTTAIVYQAGKSFTAADYAWAVQVFDATARQFAEFFQQYDVLMTPTMAIPPPAIGYLKPNQYEQIILSVIKYLPTGSWLQKFIQPEAKKNFAFVPFTSVFNITGQPAMSVPLFWDQNKLPIGIQFAGRFGEDLLLLQLARQLEEIKPFPPLPNPLLH